MPAPISIVIPTLNAGADLPATLQSLVPALTSGMVRDLVFADGGSSDDTHDIADQMGARVVTAPPGRGGQLARGVAAAQGDWLLILHADTQLAGDWSRALTRHMAADAERAGYFALSFRAAGLWPTGVAGWANWRARAFGLPYGDQGLFLSRGLYDAVGGYADIPLMEDVAMARALRGRLTALDGIAETSARRYQSEGWARRGARNIWTLTRYLAGTSPETLARDYARRR